MIEIDGQHFFAAPPEGRSEIRSQARFSNAAFQVRDRNDDGFAFLDWPKRCDRRSWRRLPDAALERLDLLDVVGLRRQLFLVRDDNGDRFALEEIKFLARLVQLLLMYLRVAGQIRVML